MRIIKVGDVQVTQETNMAYRFNQTLKIDKSMQLKGKKCLKRQCTWNYVISLDDKKLSFYDLFIGFYLYLIRHQNLLSTLIHCFISCYDMENQCQWEDHVLQG
jgi:hypothetical protein